MTITYRVGHIKGDAERSDIRSKYDPLTGMMTPCHGFLSGSRCDPVAETVAEPDSFPIQLVFLTLRLFIPCNVISTCCIMERRTKRELY